MIPILTKKNQWQHKQIEFGKYCIANENPTRTRIIQKHLGKNLFFGSDTVKYRTYSIKKVPVLNAYCTVLKYL
jgi:hypothetical protein